MMKKIMRLITMYKGRITDLIKNGFFYQIHGQS